MTIQWNLLTKNQIRDYLYAALRESNFDDGKAFKAEDVAKAVLRVNQIKVHYGGFEASIAGRLHGLGFETLGPEHRTTNSKGAQVSQYWWPYTKMEDERPWGPAPPAASYGQLPIPAKGVMSSTPPLDPTPGRITGRITRKGQTEPVTVHHLFVINPLNSLPCTGPDCQWCRLVNSVPEGAVLLNPFGG